MRFEPYWARATATHPDVPGTVVTGYGHSSVSEEEARLMAQRHAERLAASLATGDWPEYLDYEDGRPVREEVVDQLSLGGSTIAILFRNSYGSLVVNASEAMFIDIDRRESGGISGLLGRLFGRSRQEGDPLEAAVRRTVEETSGMGVRLYRTAAGLRALVTSEPVEPNSARAADLLRRFNADPAYARLCDRQNSFRARVTPKPWRCQCERPPSRYPWADDQQEAAYRAWELAYHEKSRGWSACELVATLGVSRVHPRIQPVIEFHDALGCTGGRLA